MAPLVERKVSDRKVAGSWFDSQTGMCRWAQLVERKVSDRKIAASWFDSQTGMCRWEKHFTLIFLWGKQSTRCGGPT